MKGSASVTARHRNNPLAEVAGRANLTLCRIGAFGELDAPERLGKAGKRANLQGGLSGLLFKCGYWFLGYSLIALYNGLVNIAEIANRLLQSSQLCPTFR